MHIRFVTAKRDSQSGRRQGLFYAAYELDSRLDVSVADRHALDEIHIWFSKNMLEPTRATWSARPNRTATALSWFREEAVAHVSKMRELQSVLEKYGIFAETLRTARPGYIVYEDKCQVVAYPFADTPT